MDARLVKEIIKRLIFIVSKTDNGHFFFYIKHLSFSHKFLFLLNLPGYLQSVNATLF